VTTCRGRFYEKYTAKELRQERLDESARDGALAAGGAGVDGPITFGARVWLPAG
jgi:hypothetical protein